MIPNERRVAIKSIPRESTLFTLKVPTSSIIIDTSQYASTLGDEEVQIKTLPLPELFETVNSLFFAFVKKENVGKSIYENMRGVIDVELVYSTTTRNTDCNHPLFAFYQADSIPDDDIRIINYDATLTGQLTKGSTNYGLLATGSKYYNLDRTVVYLRLTSKQPFPQDLLLAICPYVTRLHTAKL